MSPDEGPVHLHGSESQEDHLRSLDIRLPLLRSLAFPDEDSSHLLQRVREYGNLHLRFIEKSVRGLFLGRSGLVLHFAIDPVLRLIQPDCKDPFLK
ncbi:hypothetical protein NPIL_72411 [Nephila pilipes]|uniref:Uncharacterized protein n=1 Tax=Nephila pilipes TaxID=299642 RepID=A0A8X6T3V8_NEPPI|nr:hypothetical protein NPIL_72411 [Nephila pilipes]